MPSNETTDPALDKYYALRPTLYRRILRFELSQSNSEEANSMTLQIDLESSQSRNRPFLRLTFYEVRDFRYVPGYWSFANIEITSLKERQWDRKNYRVFEAEQDTDFSFTCASFETKVISV